MTGRCEQVSLLAAPQHGRHVPPDPCQAGEKHVEPAAEQQHALERTGPATAVSPPYTVYAQSPRQQPDCGQAGHAPHLLQCETAV